MDQRLNVWLWKPGTLSDVLVAAFIGASATFDDECCALGLRRHA